MRVAVWNAEWAVPGSRRGVRFAAALAACDADAICLTEGEPGLFPVDGHVAPGPPHDGFPHRPQARRVLLWSRMPMSDVDPTGHPDLPHEAFVSARLNGPAGAVRIASICIPWRDAGVRRFGGTWPRWGAHRAYLGLLSGVVAEMWRSGTPVIIAGDFNQHLPRIWSGVPQAAHQALLEALDGLAVPTCGAIPGLDSAPIDHLAHTPDLVAHGVRGWPGRPSDGKPLSDHSGVVVDLASSETVPREVG